MFSISLRRASAAFVLPAVLLTAACEDEVTAPEVTLAEGEVQINASSPTDFVFFSLESGQVVQVASPESSNDWDIGFRRFSLKLNGGVAGPGGVAGYNLANNEGATEEQVLAFTPADGQTTFDAITEADISGAQFIEDGLIADRGGPFFRFSPQAGTLVANPGAAWRVRDAEGAFGVFRVAELNMAGQIPLGKSIEYRYQPAGGAVSELRTVAVNYGQGTNYVDLSTGATVTPDGCNWDIAFTPEFEIEFNADCQAGSFPIDPTEDFTALTDASNAPEYGPFLSTISGAIPNTISSPRGPFLYNLEGNQRLWPTFNVFLIRKGSAVYKIQITDYYNVTGDSGYPTLRYEQLR